MESELKTQDMRRHDERDDKTDFQRCDEARRLHTTNMEEDTYKSDLQKKKETWKKSETNARFVLCQHFTNCSQQPYTTDSTADSTKRNQKNREDLDVLTRRWTILQHTDCWNGNVGSGVSKCGSRQWTSRKHLTQLASMESALKNAVSNHITSAS